MRSHQLGHELWAEDATGAAARHILAALLALFRLRQPILHLGVVGLDFQSCSGRGRVASLRVWCSSRCRHCCSTMREMEQPLSARRSCTLSIVGTFLVGLNGVIPPLQALQGAAHSAVALGPVGLQLDHLQACDKQRSCQLPIRACMRRAAERAPGKSNTGDLQQLTCSASSSAPS